MTETTTRRRRPLYELRFGPLTVSSRRIVEDVDPAEVSTVTDQWDEPGVRYEPVVEDVWYLHGIDYNAEWPDCGVVAYGQECGENIAEDDIEAAKAWASRLISAISEYHVEGWSSCIPRLFELRHELTFELTTSSTVKIEVCESEATRIVNQFNRPPTHDFDMPNEFGGQVPSSRDTIMHRYPDQSDGMIQIVRINLAQVAAIRETIRTQRVECLV